MLNISIPQALNQQSQYEWKQFDTDLCKPYAFRLKVVVALIVLTGRGLKSCWPCSSKLLNNVKAYKPLAKAQQIPLGRSVKRRRILEPMGNQFSPAITLATLQKVQALGRKTTVQTSAIDFQCTMPDKPTRCLM